MATKEFCVNPDGKMSEINPRLFYGPVAEEVPGFKVAGDLWKELSVKEHRRMPEHILGPTQFWREFPRQADALRTAESESTVSDVLCTFVNQGDEGYRTFVVAHPECFWWYYRDRPADRRCSYEVIPECSPCRLYLDLEYLYELNPTSDGPRMTNTLTDILCSYLLARYGLPCSRTCVINLDSSNAEKFSRHLIFNLKDTAFKDNGQAGRFVKTVCNEILEFVLNKGTSTRFKILGNFNMKDIEGLMVATKTGRRLFVDTGVYTRNRHFRIYKSTKWGKSSHLTVSEDSQYVPPYKSNDPELSFFLDSLVSYFPNKKHLCLLECSPNESTTTTLKPTLVQSKPFVNNDAQPESKYPSLDRYIQELIQPGRIRACTYFEVSKTLIYATVDYRYCENIGRCHKSNNVFLVVDLPRRIVYQKCHDPECRGFKSRPRPLPEKLYLEITDDDDEELLAATSITEEIAEQSDIFFED